MNLLVLDVARWIHQIYADCHTPFVVKLRLGDGAAMNFSLEYCKFRG